MSDSLNNDGVTLFAGDLLDRALVSRKLRLQRDAKSAELALLRPFLPTSEAVRRELDLFDGSEVIADCADIYRAFAQRVSIIDEAGVRALFERPGCIIFEGAQGVLLDENYGFAPYTTWSTTTFANAETLIDETSYTGEVVRLGVVRAYATRHGAGPFPSEDPTLAPLFPEPHNVWNDWQHTFRVGPLDLLALRYAIEVIGQLDALAVTHLDSLSRLTEPKICLAYRYQGEQTDLAPYFEQDTVRLTKIRVRRPIDLVHQEQLAERLFSCVPEYRATASLPQAYLSLLEEELALPIGISSYGPDASAKRVHTPAHVYA